MNQLCMDLERWEHALQRKKNTVLFDWTIMFDESVGYDENVFKEIEKIYLDFNKTIKDLSDFERKCKNYDKYKTELTEEGVTKEQAAVFEVDWEYYYNIYRNKCQSICPDVKQLANISVILCYKKYARKSKKFMWRVAGRGIVDNVKQIEIELPMECAEGKYSYLGRKFCLSPIINNADDRMSCEEADK